MGFQVQEPQQEETGQAQEGEDFGQIQEGCSLGANPLLRAWPIPFPCQFCWPVCQAIATAFTTQAVDIVGEIKMMCDKHNHLVQETGKVVMEGARMSNWVLDLKDEKYKM